MKSTSTFLAEVTANNRALLYRSRWSRDDAGQVVPRLAKALSDHDESIIHEALGALVTIGPLAVGAAPGVARLTQSSNPFTRKLAVFTLGQIACKEPELCVGPTTNALHHAECRHYALRILAFLGREAKRSLVDVAACYEGADAKTRRLAVVAAILIDESSEITRKLVARAEGDPSKQVRTAAEKAMKKARQGGRPNAA